MEPRIQYAKTSDGINIAYAVFGTGPAIVFPSSIFGNLHLYTSATSRAMEAYDDLVSLGWSVITYDGRGAGSSDRDTDDWTLDARVRDLESVVERAAPERFVLCGTLMAGPTSISYVVRHPARITHLILSNTFAAGSNYYELVPPMRVVQQTLRGVEDNWEYTTLTIANAFTNYTDSDRARRMAESFRTAMTARTYVAFQSETARIDVRDLLSEISVPTIVIHDRRSQLEGVRGVTRQLAPAIPNARFVETDDFAGVVDEFLRESGLEPSPPPLRGDPSPVRGRGVEVAATPAATGMTAILFADIVGSTALTETLGDAAFRDKARDLDAALRAIIREHSGTCIDAKTLGDGVLATFASAARAIEAALACGRAGADAGLPLHLGLHAGDVIREENNVFGGAVNIAARISGLSAPGELLVSDTVRSLARTSASVTFEDRGEQRLKGVGEAVRVFAVRKDGE